MNGTTKKTLTPQNKADIDIAVKKIVKKYHKTLSKLAKT